MEDNLYTPGPESTDSSTTPLPQITLESLGYLNTAAKWAKFLAILGFIGIGFMLLAGLFVGVFFSFLNFAPLSNHFPFPMGFIGFIYIVLAAVYVMPVIYLNNFSNNVSKAVAFRETEHLTEALLSLKRHYKYVGIMTIALIGSYFVIMAGVMIFVVTNAMHRF